jgi:hypothetical protein
MPLPLVDETRTSKSCITNGPFGGATAIRNGRRFPRLAASGQVLGRLEAYPTELARGRLTRSGWCGDPGTLTLALSQKERDRKGRKTLTLASPKGRGMSEVNLKWSRETDLRRLESMKQMYTQRLAAR